jgi:hypothetical protein
MLKCRIRTSHKPFVKELKGCSVNTQPQVYLSTSLFKQLSANRSGRPLGQNCRHFTHAAVESAKAKKAMDWLNSFLQKLNKSYINKEVTGPTPFDIVDDDLKQLKVNISNLLSHTEHALLKTIANYYFNLKGKSMRPTIVLLLARALQSHIQLEESNAIFKKQLQLAEIIEMIHTASIIHDDVIDNATTRRGEPSINIAFGNKLAILSGLLLSMVNW